MSHGPGKYDDAATAAREISGGGVVLIVVEGKLGHGFSAQVSAAHLRDLPEMLEEVAAQLRRDRQSRP